MCKYKKSISGSIKNKKRVPQFPTDELEDCTKTQYTINKDCLSSNANGSKFCVMPVSWPKKKLHYLTPQKWDCIEWLNQKRCYTGQETHEVGFSSISGGQINENEIQFVQIIFY